MKISFLNAPAGSGKTQGAILGRAVKSSLDGARILVAMPTKDLIGQTIAAIGKMDRPPTVDAIISGDNSNEKNVVKRTIDRLRAPFNGGELVFITHECLKRLPYRGMLPEWRLIVDEVPQVHRFYDLILNDETRTLLQHCRDNPSPFEGLRNLSLSKDPKKILGPLNGSKDRQTLYDLAYDIRAPKSWVHAPDKSVETLRSANSFGKKFHAFSTVTPELVKPFAGTLILSANFKNTLLYHLWSRNGVHFEEDRELAAGLRFDRHEGSKTTIHYVVETDWSTSLQGKPIADQAGTRVHSKIVEKASIFFGDRPFLWVANKRYEENLFPNNPSAERLPNVSHGINRYSDVDNVIFLSALNPSTTEFGYFKTMGVTPVQARKAFFHETLYQGVLRCSLRSQDDSRPVQIVVMDRSSADYLSGMLPGSTVCKLDWLRDQDVVKGKPGPKIIHPTNAQRQAAYRNRRKKVLDHNRFVADADKRFVDDGCYDSSIIYKEFVTKQFWCMQFRHITAKRAQGIFLTDLPAFVDHLKNMAMERIEKKEDRTLISPAYFNPEKHSETDRGNKNVEFLRGIWLDQDGGIISPDEFSKLFPDLQMIIFNTFSSTKERLRYRVFIPTTTIFSAETHATITNEIWSRFHKAGYGADTEAKTNEHCQWHGC